MTKVLLLDVHNNPLAVISSRRAMGLVLSDKAVALEASPSVLRSPTHTFHLPSVIRLRYYVRVPQRKVRWSRANVLRRDHYTCQYCGLRMADSKATIDHVVPISACKRMGINPDTWGNTVACCAKCQRRKGDRPMAQVGMKFYDPNFEPKMPRVNYLVFILTSGNLSDEWRKYVQI